LGAGVASYSTSDYKENALSGVTPRVSPALQMIRATILLIKAGAGIDYALQENLSLNGRMQLYELWNNSYR